MKQKRIRKALYSEQKIGRKNNRFQYIEDPDGYLFSDNQNKGGGFAGMFCLRQVL